MNHTKIEWVKNPDGTQGYTWNPITGCLNGCPYCYARKLANGRLKQRYLANKNVAPEIKIRDKTFGDMAITGYLDPFYPRFWEKRLWDLPIEKRAKSRGIFVCDMSDLFGIGIPEEWTKKVFARMWWGKQHRFYLLTKQPQNLIRFSPFPDNCWVGVTVTSNGAMTLAMTHLANIKAKVRYLSFEPLLGGIGMSDHMSMKDIINWVIIGAQTKPYKPPKIEWVEEIVKSADRVGIPVFLKDNLAVAVPFFKEPFCQETEGKDGIKVVGLRQEMPGA